MISKNFDFEDLDIDRGGRAGRMDEMNMRIRKKPEETQKEKRKDDDFEVFDL